MEINILNFIQALRTPFFDWFMPLVSGLGDKGIIWIILAAVLTAAPKTRKTGIVLICALLIDALLCNAVLKPLVGRIRPCDAVRGIDMLIAVPTDFSFPSGHTAAAFASVCALYKCKSRLWIGAAVPAVLIAFSRMYLYVHYPSDILGGIAVGIIAGCAGYAAANKITETIILRSKCKDSRG